MQLKLANDQYFLLHSCCKPVKGAARSLICDLQRKDFIFIPNEFADLFLRDEELTWDDLKREFIEYVNFEEEMLACIDMLLSKEYAFYTREPHLFPPLTSGLADPAPISNCVIDIDGPLQFEIERFVKDLSEHLCFAVQLRFFSLPNLDELRAIVDKFTDSTIRHVELTLPFGAGLENVEEVRQFISDFPKCKRVTIYNSPDKNEEYNHFFYQIFYTDFKLTEDNCCGYISPHYFMVNSDKFFEAMNFNTCLNKKVSIDKKGNVCNCPSMKRRFAHYDDLHSIGDVIHGDVFKGPGRIKKDDIKVCRDCEFRYICHDCRAFLVDSNDEYSKPLHCKYDPYEAKWN